MIRSLASLAALAALGTAAAAAQDAPAARFTATEAVESEAETAFADWVAAFRAEAAGRGYAPDLLETAFAGVQSPDLVAIERSRSQPEFVRPVGEYLASALSERRVEPGRAELARKPDLFDALEAEYGVGREVLTAIWGLESAYGAIQGDHDVFRALATLGWAGWREAFVREQLYAALDILADGEARRDQLKGSWASAMGQTQFIPSSHRRYAVDWTGDGLKDIWGADADALASAANYLGQSGWRAGVPWGVEVTLSDSFDWSQYDETERLTAYWATLGVMRADGDPWGPELQGLDADLVLPAGAEGPAFLTFDNFDVIKRYNNSTAYALAVGLLSDVFAGRPAVRAAWPDSGRPLRRAEVYELQDALTAIGFDTGGADGLIGPKTRKAVRAFQRETDLTPDGHVNSDLLDRVRRSAASQ